MNHFIFNGIRSDAFGAIVENPPAIPVAQPRMVSQKVTGSPKVLHFTEGPTALEPVTLSLDCAIVSPSDADIAGLCAWLRGGGALVVPGDEHHSRRAWVKNQIDLEKVLRARPDRRFRVEFECEGLRYLYPAAEAHEVAQGLVENPGSAPAEPLIRITGSGDIDLMVGTSSLVIDGVDGYVMIDCEAQMVYKGDANLGSAVTRLGDWPTIPAGGCMINWSGDVTKVEITPRWRDY